MKPHLEAISSRCEVVNFTRLPVEEEEGSIECLDQRISLRAAAHWRWRRRRLLVLCATGKTSVLFVKTSTTSEGRNDDIRCQPLSAEGGVKWA
jgi:hypothetical protein